MKEKADKLVEKFRVFAHCPFTGEGLDIVAEIDTETHNAKQCALIATQGNTELLKSIILKMSVDDKCYSLVNELLDEEQKIKQEIEKL